MSALDDLDAVLGRQPTAAATPAPALSGSSLDDINAALAGTLPPPAAAPPEEPSFLQKFLYGFTDPARGTAQLMSHAGIPSPVFGPSEFGGWSPDVENPVIAPKEAAASFDAEEARYQRSRAPGSMSGTTPIPSWGGYTGSQIGGAWNPPGMDVARLGGNLMSPMSFVGGGTGTLPTVLGKGATVGGLSALTAPINTEGMNEADYWKQKERDFGLGAGVGAIGNAVVRPITGALSSAQQALKDAGVWLTPGAGGGIIARGLEDLAGGTKFIRGYVQAGAEKMLDSFNRATHNDVLESIGEKLPNSIPAGHAAWGYSLDAFNKAYDNTLGKVTFQPGQIFNDGLDAIKAKLSMAAPSKMGTVFDNYIKSTVLDPIEKAGGALPGDVMKTMETTLRTYAQKLNAKGGFTGVLGDAVNDVRALMRTQLRDNHPELAPTLDAIDRGYARLSTIKEAGLKAINKEGVFTPSELERAIANRTNPNDVLKGGAPLQTLTDAAQKVIGSRRAIGGSPATGPDVLVANILAHHLGPGASLAGGAYLGAGGPGTDYLPPALKYVAAGLLALPATRRAGTATFRPGGPVRTVAGRLPMGAPLAVPGLLGPPE